MKRILFPTLLIATLLAGGVVAFAIWRSAPQTPQDLLADARKHYEAKDYETAKIQLLNTLQRDNRNREAYRLLAETYIIQNDPGAAAKQLRALLDYFPDDREASLRLGTLYLGGGEATIKESISIAEKLIAKNEKDVEAIVLKANAKAGLRDFSESQKLFEQAVTLDPQNTSALISLGTTQILQKRLPEAEENYLKARKLDPKNKAALTSLANYYRAVKETEKAESTLKEAVALYPLDPQVYWPLAELYYQTGRFDEAVKLLADTQAKSSDNPQAGFLLSELYMVRNQRADALRVLMDLRKEERLADNLDLAAKIATHLIPTDPAAAGKEIDRILAERPGHPYGLLLKGQLQFVSGDLDGAKTTLSQPQAATSRLPDVQYLLGSIEAKRGQLDSALDFYRKALVLQPAYLPARAALASVLLDKGSVADAKAEVKKATDQNARFAPARVVKAAVDRAEKRFVDSEQELKSLLAEQPSNPDLHAQLVLTHVAMGRTAEAEKSVLKVLELQPDSLERLQWATRFYVETRQPQKAIGLLTAIPDEKKQPQHYELLGIAYANSGKLAEAEASYKQALQGSGRGTNADALLAELYIRTGRTDEGLRKLDEIIQKTPASAGAHVAKGSLYEAKGNIDQAIDSYNRALQINPNLDFAANNLAYIFAERDLNLERALTLAQGVRKRQPDSPSIADTLGWVYYKLGNHTLARDQLLFAISKQPDNPTLQYHLGMIYKGNNQPKEAAEALRKAANSPKDFKEKPLAQAALKEVNR